MQDSFVKIWHHASDYDPDKGNPLTWMGSIVRNRALDILRRSKREKLIDQEPNEAEAANDLSSPLEDLVKSREAEALKNCMGQLDRDQQKSLLLAYWNGLSHQELAVRLARPLGTVKTWVRRGLERLRNCLEGGH